MIKDEIAGMIEAAAKSAQEAGELPAVALPEIVVEHPQRAEHGDYATSLPLRLARPARANPLDLARILMDRLPASAALERAAGAPPGSAQRAGSATSAYARALGMGSWWTRARAGTRPGARLRGAQSSSGAPAPSTQGGIWRSS